MTFLNSNAGAVTALATIALLLVTGYYAWTTRALLAEAKQSRLLTNQPRIVAYLRVHETHINIAQLCVANLSGAAAISVSASIHKVTEWPKKFDLEDSAILRELCFMRPHEVLRFDLGNGLDLFKNGLPATFHATISYQSLDGRAFSNEHNLSMESVNGYSQWRIYGIDDVARRLSDISDTLKALTGSTRLKVETYDAHDRDKEHKEVEEQRERFKQKQTERSET